MKSVASAVGMPDDEDKKIIRRLILKFEKKHPGYIQQAINEAKADYQAQGKEKFALVNKQAHGRVIFELPEELHQWIERYIPSIFSDKDHFHWFVNNFKELMVPEKY